MSTMSITSRVASATFDFLDVEQIEVLRGPQGTLYGKNTTAGAINITTRQPTFDFEGRAEVTIGNLGFKQAKAAVSGPLSDTVAARLAMSVDRPQGHDVQRHATGNWINEQDNVGLRAQLLWRPADNVDVTLPGDYSVQNPECCAQIYVRTGATQRAVNRQYAALAAAQNYAVPSTNAFDRLTDVDADLNAGNTDRRGSSAGEVGYRPGHLHLGHRLALLGLETGQRPRLHRPADHHARRSNPSQQNQYTQEFRYARSGDSFDFVAGLFGFHQTCAPRGLQRAGLRRRASWLLHPFELAGAPLANIPRCWTA